MTKCGKQNVTLLLTYRKDQSSRNSTITVNTLLTFIWAPSSEFVSLSIPSWQSSTAHAQPFRGARDLAFCLKVPLDSLLVWASSEGSGETARMRRLAWTFAARIGEKYQIRLSQSIWSNLYYVQIKIKEKFHFKCCIVIYYSSGELVKIYSSLSSTVMILIFRTARSGQTVQTQIRLLLEEESDQGIHCLPFHQHYLDTLLYSKIHIVQLQ